MERDLQESYWSSSPFTNGDLLKLFVSRFGEVGEGLIVQVCPQGQWWVWPSCWIYGFLFYYGLSRLFLKLMVFD